MKWTYVSCCLNLKTYCMFHISHQAALRKLFQATSALRDGITHKSQGNWSFRDFCLFRHAPVDGAEPGQWDKCKTQKGTKPNSDQSIWASIQCLPAEESRGAIGNGEHTRAAWLLFPFGPSTWQKTRLQLPFCPLLVTPNPCCCELRASGPKDLSKNI